MRFFYGTKKEVEWLPGGVGKRLSRRKKDIPSGETKNRVTVPSDERGIGA